MKNVKVAVIVMLAILAVPWVYLAVIFPVLPASVPVHFGIDGKPDSYGDRQTLMISMAVLTALGAGIFFLLKNIHKIDPKKSAGYSPAAFNKIAIALVIFMAILNIIVLSSAVKGRFETNKSFMPVIGLFFAYLGNVFYSVKPNYFVGFRLPWTLENENNWRKTHQLAGKLWFGGGLLIAACSLLLQDRFSGIMFFTVVALIVVIPVIYSFTEFKKDQQ